MCICRVDHNITVPTPTHNESKTGSRLRSDASGDENEAIPWLNLSRGLPCRTRRLLELLAFIVNSIAGGVQVVDMGEILTSRSCPALVDRKCLLHESLYRYLLHLNNSTNSGLIAFRPLLKAPQRRRGRDSGTKAFPFATAVGGGMALFRVEHVLEASSRAFISI